ncbi:hypothetical protein ABTQ00_19535, partial [Acinetobacter baumannii]
SRLKAVIASQKSPLIYRWDEKDNKLLPVSLSWQPQTINLDSTTQLTLPSESVAYSPALNLSSAGVDYIDVRMNIPQSVKP